MVENALMVAMILQNSLGAKSSALNVSQSLCGYERLAVSSQRWRSRSAWRAGCGTRCLFHNCLEEFWGHVCKHCCHVRVSTWRDTGMTWSAEAKR